MSAYRFYADLLRFVAGRSDRSDPAVAAMMQALGGYAAEIESSGAVTVAPAELAAAARAFAGVAGLLQRLILPEAVAAGHTAVEARIRWSVDASMELVRTLLAHAAEGATAPVTVKLPPPP